MTDEQKQKPKTFKVIVVGVLAGAVVGLLFFAAVTLAVLAIGGLEHGIVTRGMWRVVGILTALSIVAAIGLLACIGESFGEKESIEATVTIAMLTTFAVQISLVALVAYEIAPRFPEASEIKAEAE